MVAFKYFTISFCLGLSPIAFGFRFQADIDNVSSSMSNAPNEKTITFEKGPLGLDVGMIKDENDNVEIEGYVTAVNEGQAKEAGVKKGWQIKSVDGYPYTKELLTKQMSESDTTKVTFGTEIILLDRGSGLSGTFPRCRGKRVKTCKDWVAYIGEDAIAMKSFAKRRDYCQGTKYGGRYKCKKYDGVEKCYPCIYYIPNTFRGDAMVLRTHCGHATFQCTPS